MKPKKVTPKVNKIEQHKKQLIEALTNSLGIVTEACRICGLSRGIFYQYYNTDPNFKKQVDDVDNIALDFAETQLHKQIKEGVPVSTIFYLKSKGKSRGYVERSEVEITDKRKTVDELFPTEDELKRKSDEVGKP